MVRDDEHIHAAEPAPNAASLGDHGAVFAALLAVAHLSHTLTLSTWHPLEADVPAALLAIWLLARPSSLRRLGAFAAGVLVEFLVDLPVVTNHMMFLGLSAIGLGACMLATGARRPTWPTLYRWCAPVLRWGLLVVYVLAAVAKLNRGFLHPELSAAVQMYGELAERLPILPNTPAVARSMIGATLVIELALPLLLAVPATRLPGVLVGSVFHTFLALQGHVPFSGFVFALYWLFVPEDQPARVRRLLADHRRLGAAVRWAATPWRRGWVFPVLAASWLLLLGLIHLRLPDLAALARWHGRRVFALYAVGLVAVVVVTRWRAGPWQPMPEAFRLPARHAAIPIGVLVLNGLCPYVGLKTETSYTMYSNLQTEGDLWNHLLLPLSMRRFGYQDELAQLLDSDDPVLRSDAEQGTRWVPFELQRYLSERPHVEVRYQLRGVLHHQVAGGPPVPPPGNPIERKLLWFRPVRAPENNGVTH